MFIVCALKDFCRREGYPNDVMGVILCKYLILELPKVFMESNVVTVYHWGKIVRNCDNYTKLTGFNLDDVDSIVNDMFILMKNGNVNVAQPTYQNVNKFLHTICSNKHDSRCGCIIEKYGFGSDYCGFDGRYHKTLFKNVKFIECKWNHTLAINHDNELFVCGYQSTDGRLGIGIMHKYSIHEPIKINLPNVTMASCGHYHSMALSNGELFAWGYDGCGALGLGYDI